MPWADKPLEAIQASLRIYKNILQNNIARNEQDMQQLPNYRPTMEPHSAPSANPNVATNASGANMVNIKGPDGTTKPFPEAIANKMLKDSRFTRG